MGYSWRISWVEWNSKLGMNVSKSFRTTSDMVEIHKLNIEANPHASSIIVEKINR